MNRRFAFIPGLFLSLVACGGGGGNSNPAQGELTLQITDAPVTGVSKVVVTVSQVEIKPKNQGPITIALSPPKQFDLLANQGGDAFTLFANEPVPEGEYNWVKLTPVTGLSNSYVEIAGETKELSFPSDLKLVSGFSVPGAFNSEFVIDFDVRKGLVQDANGIKLKPAMRIVASQMNGSELMTAKIMGTVDNTLVTSCADASVDAGSVYVYAGADVTPDDMHNGATAQPLTSAIVSTTDYSYVIAFLEPGDYTVSYTCGADDPEVDDAITFSATTNVSVTAGGNKTVDLM
jgi:hypothetical protein